MKKEVGEVLDLFITGAEKRVAVQELELDGEGAVGDKFRGKDMQRSVLIASRYSYELCKENDISVSYGDLGENILIDYNPYALEVGSRLTIGEAVLEITQQGTLCPGLSKVNPKLPKLLKGRRGIFAKVVNNGTIKKGNSVAL